MIGFTIVGCCNALFLVDGELSTMGFTTAALGTGATAAPSSKGVSTETGPPTALGTGATAAPSFKGVSAETGPPAHNC